MTGHRKDRHPIENLADDVRLRQRNTTWPDVMVNASSTDKLMWKGSPRITKVQRIGVALFGFLFVLGGLGIAISIRIDQGGWWLGIPIAAAFVLVGCKLLWNSVRKNVPKKSAGEDE
ncbi:MAG: hypothetical protein ABSA39_08425 [Edaphobacter sp.]